MDSVNKLRGNDGSLGDLERRLSAITGCGFIGDALNVIADEIKSEIAERYMELPTDADGVPIRVGDVMEAFDCLNDYVRFVVGGYTSEFPEGKGVLMVESEPDDGAWYGRDIRHVKQRTLESVLLDMLGSYYRKLTGSWATLTTDEELASGYADEIRELLGGAE